MQYALSLPVQSTCYSSPTALTRHIQFYSIPYLLNSILFAIYSILFYSLSTQFYSIPYLLNSILFAIYSILFYSLSTQMWDPSPSLVSRNKT
ncbi:hypothetical protein M8J75_013530 [Diaphorina citri]|nr:hypothetical protein M8J75_013530 [Diaphorina citri]